MTMLRLLATAALLLPAGAAVAQTDAATSVDEPPSRPTITAGIGAAILPDYEGSDDYRLIPAAQARGNVAGYNFFTRGLALYVDVIPEPAGETLDFSAGPVVAGRFSRTNVDSIEDVAIRNLGELDTAIEVGGFVGIAKTGIITSAYDVASARIAYQRDVAGSHDSYVLTPSIEYGTPLSTRNFVGLAASLDFVGDGYARQYFGITPGQSAASGLAPYSVDGGLKSYSVTLIGAQSLSGDIREGFAAFGTVGYTRLLGDFADSPVVTVAGSANQWLFAAGIGYTF